jgi:predicted amidohydrolase
MGTVLSFEGSQEAVLNVTLNKSNLDEYRRKFPVHLDADEFEVGTRQG